MTLLSDMRFQANTSNDIYTNSKLAGNGLEIIFWSKLAKDNLFNPYCVLICSTSILYIAFPLYTEFTAMLTIKYFMLTHSFLIYAVVFSSCSSSVHGCEHPIASVMESCNVPGWDLSLFLCKQLFLSEHPTVLFSGISGALSTGRLSWREHAFHVTMFVCHSESLSYTPVSKIQPGKTNDILFEIWNPGKIYFPLFSPSLKSDRFINFSLQSLSQLFSTAMIWWFPYEWVSSYIIMRAAIRISVWTVADILPHSTLEQMLAGTGMHTETKKHTLKNTRFPVHV